MYICIIVSTVDANDCTFCVNERQKVYSTLILFLLLVISLKVVSGTEWLEFTDFIDQAVLKRQSYNLMAYSPFLSVAFHFFFATAQSNSKLSYPNSQYEAGV